MSSAKKTFVFVVSTGGAVMNTVLHNNFLRSKIHSVVFDHSGADTENLHTLGVPYETVDDPDVGKFCERLLDYAMANEIDYILSYYTKFYSKKFRDYFKDRIINFHPSLLPAFKGMDGFGDAIAYHARLTGNTVEFIDEVMDEGKIILQTVCPVNLTEPIASTRHVVFIQQCKALIQIVRWLSEGRLRVDGRRVVVQDALFRSIEFSPELDFAEARNFSPERAPRAVSRKET